MSKKWIEACPGDLVPQFKLFFEKKNDKNILSLWKKYNRTVSSTVGILGVGEELLHLKLSDSISRRDLCSSFWWWGWVMACSMFRGSKCDSGVM